TRTTLRHALKRPDADRPRSPRTIDCPRRYSSSTSSKNKKDINPGRAGSEEADVCRAGSRAKLTQQQYFNAQGPGDQSQKPGTRGASSFVGLGRLGLPVALLVIVVDRLVGLFFLANGL